MSGVCRICGCTEATPCTILSWDDPSDVMPCGWLDKAQTLCTNPRCVALVPIDELLEIVFPRLPHQVSA